MPNIQFFGFTEKLADEFIADLAKSLPMTLLPNQRKMCRFMPQLAIRLRKFSFATMIPSEQFESKTCCRNPSVASTARRTSKSKLY